MRNETAAECRAEAERFRKMSETDVDFKMRLMLLRLAAEFDKEAARIEALEAAEPQPDDSTPT